MTTKTFLFANRATTLLAAPINSTATSLTVAAGTGALFPIPGGNIFAITLNDALTGNVVEVIYVQNRNTDTLYGLLRGQEGTTATNWLAGDTVAQWFTAGQAASFLQRIQLLANLNLYVNGSTGSDSNNGLSPSTAFATMQFAWNFLLTNYDLNGFSAEIVQNGTNTDKLVANGSVIGAASLGSVVISVGGTWSVTNGSCIAVNGAAFSLQGAGTLSASGTGPRQGYAILAFSGAQVGIQGITFGACGNAHMAASQGAQISALAAYTIGGSAPAHIVEDTGASVDIAGIAITLTGTPAFSTAFAAISNCATIQATGATFSGSATGSRYNVQKNASLDTGGGGATFLPGNASGTVATGGQYN